MIQTYGRQGLGKPGTVKAHHSIIYSDQPHLEENEWPGLDEEGMQDPIEVRLDSRLDRLDPMSRLNYRRYYTVQHNWEVADLGRVTAGSWARLLAAHETIAASP